MKTTVGMFLAFAGMLHVVAAVATSVDNLVFFINDFDEAAIIRVVWTMDPPDDSDYKPHSETLQVEAPPGCATVVDVPDWFGLRVEWTLLNPPRAQTSSGNLRLPHDDSRVYLTPANDAQQRAAADRRQVCRDADPSL